MVKEYNDLVKILSQNKKTYLDCRGFLLTIFKEKEKVILLEKSHIDRIIPYYIEYIESKNLNFNQIIDYYIYDYPDYKYWDLIKLCIINCFNKMENNDFNFIPF